MDELVNILQSFESVSLEQIQDVELLDRVDTKYILHRSELPLLLTALGSEYSVLTIGERRRHAYATDYLDTPSFDLYLNHHNGMQNRYKLRFRTYIDTGLQFFEFKQKTNTHRTKKRRMPSSGSGIALGQHEKAFIRSCTGDEYSGFLPSLHVEFNRITLVNLRLKERLTIDLDLRFSTSEAQKQIDDLVIVEVKTGLQQRSAFRRRMRDRNTREFYLSKYCLGINCLRSNLKKNLFLPKLRKLKKLGYAIC